MRAQRTSPRRGRTTLAVATLEVNSVSPAMAAATAAASSPDGTRASAKPPPTSTITCGWAGVTYRSHSRRWSVTLMSHDRGRSRPRPALSPAGGR
eukprot:2979648-Pyramimonas_sp.AAC.1